VTRAVDRGRDDIVSIEVELATALDSDESAPLFWNQARSLAMHELGVCLHLAASTSPVLLELTSRLTGSRISESLATTAGDSFGDHSVTNSG
jgi:hypothetical protein